MKSRKGYIATSTVLVLMVVVLSIITTVSLLGIGEAQVSQALTKGEETLSFVEGCVEDALLNSQASASYAGGNITRPEGTCAITVDSKVGNDWTITISTTATDYKRTIRVIFNRGSTIAITSWQEI